MSAEVKERFQLSRKCWKCDELFDVGDNKVRDHCHITGEYRGSAHWSCNVNPKLKQNVPVILHSSRSFGSHLIIQEIDKFDLKVSVIPNGLQKCMAITINNNLDFIESIRFVNTSLFIKNI